MSSRKVAFGGAIVAMLSGIVCLTYGHAVQATRPGYAGAPADGGRDCTACHRGQANSDPRGGISLQVQAFKPGVKQILRVTLSHPEARRWGFQLTARIVSDETKQAGTFTASPDVSIVCGPDGRPAPCNGALEFVNQSPTATFDNRAGPVTWEIEWTPPSGDVGDVVFYVAGLAANNDQGAVGDWTYTTRVRVENEGSCPMTSRVPQLNAIVNGASFARDAPIGMNAMISIFGLGFADPGVQRPVGLGDIRDGKFPLRLACVGVEVAGRRVPVTFVRTDQINAQAPTLDPNGPVEVRIILNPGFPNEVRSLPATVRMETFSPAFFLFPNSKNIAARHADDSILAESSVVPGGTPASPGEWVVLYGTGFGPTEPVYQAGEIPDRLAPLKEPFSISIGGIVLPPDHIYYAGLATGNISGLYQFNVRVPESVPSGNVPVQVRIAGYLTPEATIPVRR
ncbi:MAG: choice-of-anchor V domain-containing protein [Bryobacteraceae bacterium]